MSARHLAARDGVLCPTITYSTRTLYATACLSDVTCSRCIKRLALMGAAESADAADRRFLARGAEDCEDLGIAHIWEMVAGAESASDRLVRDILASLARCLVETQEFAISRTRTGGGRAA